LWPLQALHAFSFGFAHLAAMAFVARYLPLRLQASGQGLMLGLSAGLVMAALSFAAGAVQVDYGMVGAWWLAATAAGAAALAAVWLRRIGPPAQPADQA
ncbi:MAG: MFS transporter, partial [Pseudomonadota bacterium]